MRYSSECMRRRDSNRSVARLPTTAPVTAIILRESATAAGIAFASTKRNGSDYSDLRSSPDEYGGPLLHRARVWPAARRGQPLGRLARVRSVRRLGGHPLRARDHAAEPRRSRILG